jgi:glycerol-3-phosphate acyltransferase PlsY
MILIFVSVLAAYLVGAFPTAYVFGKVLKNIDIRQHGSGNVGATNVFRTIGKIPGIIVLIIDFLKGFLAVTLIPLCLRTIAPEMIIPPYVYILLGAAAIAGHIWTVFLKFKGGKGVATTGGVMAGLAPGILAMCVIVWIVVFSIWRYVSLASIIAATALPVFAAIQGRDISFIIFCAILCFVGVWSHRSNIERLIKGEEKKLA